MIGVVAAAFAAPSADLVERLGWAATPAEVRAFVGDAPNVYAVEARVAEAGVAERRRQWVEIREVVVHRNDSGAHEDQLRLWMFANGEGSDVDGVMVSGVWVDNVATRYVLDGSSLVIDLPRRLARGATARILVQLAERIPSFDPRATALPSGVPHAEGWFGHAEGATNLGWFVPVLLPTAARGALPRGEVLRPPPTDPAVFHVRLTVPSSYEVASTGVEIGRETRDSERTIQIEARDARSFSAALVPNGSFTEVEVGETRLRVFTSGAAHPAAEPLLTLARDTLGVFVARFGAPHTAEIDVVEAPLRGPSAVGLGGMVLVDAAHRGRGVRISASDEGLVAQELARQWWGEDVGSDRIREPWVDDALAAWSASLYWEERHGAGAATDRFAYEVTDRLVALEHGRRTAVAADQGVWSYSRDQLAVVVRGVGQVFFRAVRDDLGDDSFFRNLARYHADFGGRMARGEDLVRAVTRGMSARAAAGRAAYWLEEPRSAADLPAE